MSSNYSVSRRGFLKTSLVGTAVLASSGLSMRARAAQHGPLRLGGPVFEKYQDPES